MDQKIALGFHVCIDYEISWDESKLKSLICKHKIYKHELSDLNEIRSERDILIIILYYMSRGIGAEFMPETSDICVKFAANFEYRETIGGTAARAAIAVSKLGFCSELSCCCSNRRIKELLPENINIFWNGSSNEEETYPHVVFTYPANVHIKCNDIDFVTERENRLIFSRDSDSLNYPISKDFVGRTDNTEVMLLSCFSEILDRDILNDRVLSTKYIIENLPERALVILEDGCYINKEYRYIVHKALKPRLDAVSMNEDELQEYLGIRIDLAEPDIVIKEIKKAYESIAVPVLIVHSSSWAVAYGKPAKKFKRILEGGINMASARFICGDNFGIEEYIDISRMPVKMEAAAFAEALNKKECICCVPVKDLRSVKNPTVVGLGDFFAGGMLPRLLEENNIIWR